MTRPAPTTIRGTIARMISNAWYGTNTTADIGPRITARTAPPAPVQRTREPVMTVQSPDRWATSPYNWVQVERLNAAGYDPDSAAEWRAEGFDVDDMTNIYGDCDLEGALVARNIHRSAGIPAAWIVPWVNDGYNRSEIVEAWEHRLAHPDCL